MTNLPKREQIKNAINEYCKSKGLSKNELATQAGVSSASLSKIENGKWDDIDERLWRKIWNKVSNANSPGIFETSDFKVCEKACQASQRHKFMIGLVADTGMGKTTALSTYSVRNRNVFYVCYEKSMAPKHFFIALLKEMGISFEGNINSMLNKIADELNTINSPLVIIDESGKLTSTMILYLHVLRDKTVKNCGIILSGMPYFKNNLAKFSNKQKEGYAEFYRRVNLWQDLKGLTRSEITFICQQNKITDVETIRDMQSKKRFGDLYNDILLHQLQLNETV